MVLKFSKFILLILSVFATGLTGICQNIQFSNIGVEDGLSHSYVRSFLQDSQGLMWIGTLDGLNLYTGYSMLRYATDEHDSNTISNNCVYAILEDSDGLIWLGTEDGLNSFNRKTGKFTRYYSELDNPNSLVHNHIRDLHEDTENNIWVVTYGGGFCKFDKTRGRFVSFQVESDSTGLKSNKINCLFVDSKGMFWLGTEDGGISIFDPKTETYRGNYYNRGSSVNLNDNTVNCVYEDRSGNFWIGTWNGGLNKYNPKKGKWEYFISDSDNIKSLPINTIRDIAYDKDNYLWVATYGGGLSRFNMLSGESTNLSVRGEREENAGQYNLWKLFKDKGDNLWIGSSGEGIYMYNRLRETFPQHKLTGSSEEVLGITAVLEDRKGIVWLGTTSGSLFYYMDFSNAPILFKDSGVFMNSSISSLYEDRAGQIWIGTSEGLFQLSADRKTLLHYKPGNAIDELDNKAILSIIEDYRGDLWLGMWGAGINIITSEELKKKSPFHTKVKKFTNNPQDSSSLSHYIVWSFMEDSQNNMWVCTGNVLNRFNQEKRSFVRFNNIKTVTSILEDDEGILWASSLSRGLYKLDKNAKVISRISNEQGAQKVVFENLLQDNSGNLWLTSRDKLYKYNPRTNKLNLFTSKYGLQDDNFLINSFANLKSGELIFGGMKGFNIFQPEIIPTEKEMPGVLITDFKVFNQSVVKSINRRDDALIKTPIFSTDSIVLSYKQNVFSIEFAALDYLKSDELRFLYKLEGFNKDWIETDSKNRTATYTNLKGGEYIFKVRTADILDSWNSEIKEVKIIITPPYWQTTWFKVLIIFSLLTILVGLFRMRIIQIKKKYVRNQEGVIIENLRKDYEMASMQVTQLQDELEKKNKKNASLALKQIANNERIDALILKIEEIKSLTKNTNLHQELNLLLRTIADEFKNSTADVDFKENINLLYDNFIERFAKEHVKLTHKDLKICSYVRMNKTNREIAEILHITKSSVEISRYRIRKKLNLPVGENLNDYILRF